MSLGPAEVFVVLIVALLVLGPEKLPGAARQAGRLVRDFRSMSTDLTNQFHAAMEEADPTKDPKTSSSAGASQKDSGNKAPSDARHPGTQGFELIDQRDEPESVDTAKDEKPPDWKPDSVGYEPPPADQLPSESDRNPKTSNDPLSRYKKPEGTNE